MPIAENNGPKRRPENKKEPFRKVHRFHGAERVKEGGRSHEGS